MPCFVFVSGYFSKKLEKRQDKAFGDLLIPYLLFNGLFGLFYLVTEHSLDTFRNIFIPNYGLWYLLALFFWRLLMPYLSKIKHIVIIALLLNLFGGLYFFSDNSFALGRTIGFLIFFLLGYIADEKVIFKINQIPQYLARILLVVELLGWMLVCRFVKYDYFFSVFVHQMQFKDLDGLTLLFTVVIYMIAFLIACINGVLFMAAIPYKTKSLWKIGKDTLPLYISHLFVVKIFYLCTKNFSDIICILLAIPLGIICVVLFSTEKYRTVFNKVINKIQSYIFAYHEGK